jgi:hypothetical protein
MKEWIWLIFVCVLSLRLQAQTNPRTFLILVDTSFSMAREQQGIKRVVHALVLDGFGGRAQQGDQLKIWTFNETVFTNRFAPATWAQDQNQPLADATSLFVDRIRFAKTTRMERASEALMEEVRSVPTCYVFILTDGEEPLKGTPFDRQLNKLFVEFERQARREKVPLVSSFMGQNGRLVSWRFHAGTGPLQMPDVPDPGPLASERFVTNLVSSARVSTDRSPVPTLASAPVTNEVRVVLAPLVQTNAPPPSAPAPIPAAVEKPTQPLTDQKAPTAQPLPAIDAPIRRKSDDAPPVAKTGPPTNSVTLPKNLSSSTELPRTEVKDNAPVTLPPAPESNKTSPTPTVAIAEPSPATSNKPPKPAIALVTPPSSSPSVPMVVGFGMVILLTAAAFFWRRGTRHKANPSLISRSMTGDPTPPPRRPGS